ncbi:alkaline phosphatase family protein [candidate division KSB1 bacterium]|nr:alkaline phosphatase family protein [candidate division KSB1 bacterium]
MKGSGFKYEHIRVNVAQLKKKLFVLGLDGVPYSLVKRLTEHDYLQNMRRIFEQGSFVRMTTVDPCVSSVAWTSFNTGVNPGKHSIFGFVDRDPRTNSLFVPTGAQIAVPTIPELLSMRQKRVITINVPGTFPPKRVNGVQVSGFLAPTLDNAVYPLSYLPLLKKFNYVIDVDASLARTDRGRFLRDIDTSFESRISTARHLLEKEDWDYFHLHIMNTDRINHFLWDDHPEDRVEFIRFYEKVDLFLSCLNDRLDPMTEFIVLSDHGFCPVKRLINLNAWLMQHSYLTYEIGHDLFSGGIDARWRAYSLYPGRIYLNAPSASPYNEVDIQGLMDQLYGLRDPENKKRVLRKIYRKEEIFSGPYTEYAPDLLLVPEDGYELKSNFDGTDIFYDDPYLRGMHTDHDAMFFIRGRRLNCNQMKILDVLPTLFSVLNVPLDHANLDGNSVV